MTRVVRKILMTRGCKHSDDETSSKDSDDEASSKDSDDETSSKDSDETSFERF